MIRRIRQWWQRRRLIAAHPSFRVYYDDGHYSVPLMHDDAHSRARLFGGVAVYCRDLHGNVADPMVTKPTWWTLAR